MEFAWDVETLDPETGETDSECGSVTARADIGARALRALVLADFEERGQHFEDWAAGEVSAVHVMREDSDSWTTLEA